MKGACMLFKILIFYLLLINTVGFVLMGLDKRKSRKNKWRIQESTLLKTAIAGGCIGVWLGMNKFHHKTKNKKFSSGIPAIFGIHIIIIIVCLIISFKI